jgi:uncharacterized tellurite resistance protein B-like protein
MTVLNRIKSLLMGDPEAEKIARDEEVKLAAAALLVEAAKLDGFFISDERREIQHVLKDHFGINDAEARTLIDAAEKAVDQSSQLYGFTKVLKDRFTPEERIKMIEMLWQVAIADGEIDHFEANLIRRVGGLLYVSDVDRGLAKQRVMARLGLGNKS